MTTAERQQHILSQLQLELGNLKFYEDTIEACKERIASLRGQLALLNELQQEEPQVTTSEDPPAASDTKK